MLQKEILFYADELPAAGLITLKLVKVRPKRTVSDSLGFFDVSLLWHNGVIDRLLQNLKSRETEACRLVAFKDQS